MQSNETAQLIDSLREAQIVKPAVLDEFLDSRRHLEPRRLATQLVEAQLLTAWQAKFLLSGRNRLRVAGYLLRDRVSRSALGDLFIAHHETLARSVELLILPASMQQDNQRFQYFLKTSSQLTQLDHPRLAHVYDIGQEGGRFFIVSELVTPLPISHFSPAEVLTEHQRAVVALDWWQALDYMHRQSSAHGNLDEQSLLIDESQRGKITQLAQALLQSQVLAQDSDLELSEKATTDRQRVAQKIDDLLFRENPIRTAIACQQALKRLRSNQDEAWNHLGQHLQELVTSLRSNETLMNLSLGMASPEAVIPLNNSTVGSIANSTGSLTNPAAGNSTTNATAAIATTRTEGMPDRRIATKSTAAATSAGPSAETWVRMVLTGVGVVMLAGILVSVLWFRGGSAATDNSSASIPKQPEEQSPSPPEKKSTPKLPNPFLNADPAPENRSATETSSPRTEPAPSVDSEPKKTATGKSQLETNPESPPNLTKPDPFQVPTGTRTQPPTALLLADQTGVTSTAGGENPQSFDLTQLPEFVELQPSENKERQPLLPWSNPPLEDLRLKLQVPADVAGKSKLFFSLAADKNSATTWNLELRTRDESSEPEVVATLSADAGQLWFQWSDNIAKNSEANFLINGRLRVARGEQEKFVRLRPTVTLEPLKLTSESFSVKQQTTLQWLPATARVELADLMLHPQWQKTFIDDITVPEKVGRRIDFKVLEVEQLCWLVFRADLDRRLTLMIDMYGPNSRSPLKPQEFAAAVQQVENTYAALVAAQAQAENQADNAPYGSRTKAREAATDARRQTTDFKKIRELTLEFSTLVTEQLDQELPLRVVYDNDDYSLILAQSGNFADKVEPSKSRTRSDR